MPEYVLGKLSAALNRAGKAMNGARILVLGIAYKKNVDDMRESPAVHVMELVRSNGGLVSYSDPHVPVFPKMREHTFELNSVELSPERLKTFDAVVLTTDHAKFDYDMIYEHSRLIIDSRGVYRNAADHIVKA
jgi:UDP-N-acetyl-D-glucosamine dehydrogenase